MKVLASLAFLWVLTVNVRAADSDSIRIVKDVEMIWQSEFNEEEKTRIRKIMYTFAVQGQRLLGKYPYKLRFYIRRYDADWGPLLGCYVKFGEAVRGVYLGVDMGYPTADFLSSWKVPHEVSHLALPALGTQNSWFYEGFATYMSRQIMKANGHYTADQCDSIYRQKFAEVKPDFDQDGTFLSVILGQTANYNYSAFYWGGASFFYRADEILNSKHNTNLCAVVKTYQKSQRLDDKNLLMVIKSWDAIVGADVFSSLMREYRNVEARTVMSRF